MSGNVDTNGSVSQGSQSRNQSAIDKIANRKGRFHFRVWNGIHLKSPFWMITFFIVGLGAAVGHHTYYSSLNNDQVGTQSKQEWSLRFGTAFAYVTQISLVASVGIAYTQWLWRTLSRTDLSIECLDSAFDADTAIISLLNKELIRKIRVGACLALLCWCLQLPSLITPATLTVLPTLRNGTKIDSVRSLDMHTGNQTRRFTTSFNTTDERNLLFSGPRTVVSRLVTATATEGVILPIPVKFPNSTYAVSFNGPAIKCEEANATVAAIIESLREEAKNNHTGEITQVANWYYGFVPALGGYNPSQMHSGVTAVSQTRLQQPMDGSNEIWMVYSRYRPGFENFTLSVRPTMDQYITCKLHRAAYEVNLSFQEIIQNVTVKREFLESIPYPTRDQHHSNETMIQHAYSAVMWAITDLLVGEMGTFSTSDSSLGGRTNFSEIKTQIAHTSLLGSSDLRVFFDKNRAIWSTDLKPSDQTDEDIRLARFRTLDVLIEELAVNVTMSFMGSPLLSPEIQKPVSISQSINTYRYSSRNLFLAYGLAIMFALLANGLGCYAFWKNKASHTRAFSAKVLTRRGQNFVKLVDQARSRGLTTPLSDELSQMRVRFDTATWTFVLIGADGDEETKRRASRVSAKLRRKSAVSVSENEKP